MKLLIVEQNSGVRHMIRSVVANLAGEIRECVNGDEALALYAVERPDLVLIDIEMKGMDGITATRRIVAADRSARVVMLADDDQPDLREVACKAGAIGYVSKENLLELIGLLSIRGER